MKNVLNSPTGATRSATVLSISKTSPLVATLLEQNGCGRVQFSGTDNDLYEPHLVFDNLIDKTATDARMRFEAIAHAVRDVLSQRWVLTENTYRQQNPKRIYYLSMEFPIGRSLSNNVTDMLLDPVVKELVNQKNLD